MNNRIKWIIFDAMGVIFTIGDDTNKLLVPFIQKHNEKISPKTINELYLKASLGRMSSTEFWHEVGLGSLYPEIEKLYLDTQLLLDDKFLQIANSMKKQYSLGLLSNDVSEWSVFLRNKFQMNFFDAVIISGDVQCRKPAFSIYKHFLKKSKALPSECIFIDDKSKNLSAAKDIGLETIHFIRHPEYTDFEPDAIIMCFDELENAVKDISLSLK